MMVRSAVRILVLDKSRFEPVTWPNSSTLSGVVLAAVGDLSQRQQQ